MDEFINAATDHVGEWLNGVSAWIDANPILSGALIGAGVVIYLATRPPRHNHRDREHDERDGMRSIPPTSPVRPIRSGSDGGHPPRSPRDDRATDQPPAATASRPATAKPPPPSSLDEQWAHANRKYQELCEEYAQFECDPYELIRLPVLADVSFETTATFVEAFHKAGQLAAESQPPDKYIPAFVAAVDNAIAAWKGAREYAERVHASQFAPQQRTLLRRIQAALNLADGAAGQHEQRAALARAGLLMRELERACEQAGRAWRVTKTATPQVETWVGHGQINAAADSVSDVD